jgi:hypothetical protein
MNTFTYGLRARPPAIGAVPKGFDSWIQKIDVSEAIKAAWHPNYYRHGILTYLVALSDSEISSYELVDMNVDPLDTLWEQFVEFCTETVEYEVEYQQFVDDYIHPDGDVRANNPLHILKPTDFFNLLEKKGFSGNLAGLKVFYNQI